MTMALRLTLLTVSMCLIVTIVVAREQVYYADFERLNVTYWNRNYLSYVNASARRYNRGDPMHYLNLYYETLVPMGNNVSFDIYVYEFLSNEYRRSFVEMHFRACDMVFKDKIIGSAFANAIPEGNRKCPFPKAAYRVENVSYPDLPVLKTFPFRKGRIYVNLTIPKTKTKLGYGYVDLAIKSRWRS